MAVMMGKFLRSIKASVTMRGAITLLFSLGVFIACLASLGIIIYMKVAKPGADIGVLGNVFLATMGYMAGILTGLLGLRE